MHGTPTSLCACAVAVLQCACAVECTCPQNDRCAEVQPAYSPHQHCTNSQGHLPAPCAGRTPAWPSVPQDLAINCSQSRGHSTSTGTLAACTTACQAVHLPVNSDGGFLRTSTQEMASLTNSCIADLLPALCSPHQLPLKQSRLLPLQKHPACSGCAALPSNLAEARWGCTCPMLSRIMAQPLQPAADALQRHVLCTTPWPLC
jgi:hypothetical protein